MNDVDPHNIVMQIPNVDFDISKNIKNNGSLLLLLINGHFSFEWRTNLSRNDHAELIKQNIPPVVSVSLEQISEIIRRDISFTEATLRFILTDSSRLPRFIFHSHPSLHIKHLTEFLAIKKIISSRQNRPNSYKITHHSTKTEADIFGYTPPSSLPASVALNVAEHNSILRKLNFRPLLNETLPVSIEELRNNDFETVKAMIFERGIENETRPYIWPLLFNAIPFTDDKNLINQHLEAKLKEYKLIKKRIGLHTKFQIDNSTALQDIQRVIYFDVMRNDRNLDAFKGDDNPNLNLLQTALTVYALFNRDTGYCQGMADLMSPLILIFVKKWNDDNSLVTFYDNSEKTPEEAESFIFWNFVGMMKLTQHERLFTRLDYQQQFILERSATIATSVHQPLKDLLDNNIQLTSLSFLFRPILLLFKREFKPDDVLRLWDSLFTAKVPYCFPRFIAASLLIMIYPKFLLHTDGTLGEVMNVLDGSMEKTEVASVLQVAKSLIKKVEEPYPKHKYVYEPLSESTKLKNYKPKYMKFRE